MMMMTHLFVAVVMVAMTTMMIPWLWLIRNALGCDSDVRERISSHVPGSRECKA
jgi:hypothetical protein